MVSNVRNTVLWASKEFIKKFHQFNGEKYDMVVESKITFSVKKS